MSLNDNESKWLAAHIGAVAQVHYNDASRPHVLMRPSISLDGNQWCALYGANLQDGVAGFGDTPESAMRDFDKNWMWQRATGASK